MAAAGGTTGLAWVVSPLILAASDFTMPTLEFSIPVHDLDAAGKEFLFPVRAAWIRGALEATTVSPASTDGELSVRVSKSGTDVVVRAKLRAELTVPCARCLEPAPVSVREDLSALAVEASSAQSPKNPRKRDGQDDEDGEDLPSDGADVIAYDGKTVVLDDLVRDEILLGIPMIPLCSDGCPGIRPLPALEGAAAGEDDVDPRLQPLMRLKKT
jgi:uncharacterized protein